MSHRVERLAEAIKVEMAQILQQLKDPRIVFTTVTRVDVSSDLRYARVRVSVLGTEDEQTLCISALRKAQGFVRNELGRRIRLRYTPELTFVLDDSIREGIRLSNLIDDVARRKGGGPEDSYQ